MDKLSTWLTILATVWRTDMTMTMTVLLNTQTVYDEHSDVDFEEQVPFAMLVQEGAIMKAKPKHFLPRAPGTGNIGQHPVIVLTKPDLHGRVKVATMSHSHPNNPPTRAASLFGLPIDPIKGESTVSVGKPKVIHMSNLKANKPHTMMTARNFASLKAEIHNCRPKERRRCHSFRTT